MEALKPLLRSLRRAAGSRWLPVLALPLGLAAAPSLAGTIGVADLPGNTSSANLGFATVKASTVFVHKTVAGVEGVGVSDGSDTVGGEIDTTEFIRVTFTESQIVNEIVLSFLYLDGNFGDTVNETARIRYGADPLAYGDLAVTSASTATWSGPGGVVTNLDLAIDAHAGKWRIQNPFGDIAVDELTFTAVKLLKSRTTADSDYALVSISSTQVPEPGTALLGFAGLLGLAALGRRRARA